jgi:hypothetical protein
MGRNTAWEVVEALGTPEERSKSIIPRCTETSLAPNSSKAARMASWAGALHGANASPR